MNKVILMGRLTKDPELQYTSANNTPVTKFTLAVDRKFNKQGEERKADFFNITAWRSTAEFCSKYFSKGLKVVVVGRLENRTWDDAEGKKHYATDVVADEVYFAEGRKQDGQGGRGDAYEGSGYSGGGNGSHRMTPEEERQQDEDDELPF